MEENLKNEIKELIKEAMSPYPDSIEIGTPSKGGTLKVYFNADNIIQSAARISEAAKLVRFTRKELEKNE